MDLDARGLPNDAVVEADVCVAGGGPAGLVVATELDAAGLAVALVERGDEPLRGEIEGAYPPLESARAGGVGGTARMWDAELAPGTYGARYAPLAAIDFEEREDIPLSGWPFDRGELEPWYARAQEICEAGPYAYESDGSGAAAAIREAGLASGVFRFGLGKVFTQHHRDRLRRSSRVRLLEPARAVGLETEAGAAVELRAAVAPGRVFTVRAQRYVLALGGIENARFLLLAGIGNEHDLVGRFLMDHPTARCRLQAARGAASRLAACDVRKLDGRPVVQTLALCERTIAREQLLNSGFFVVPARDRELRALASARSLLAAGRAGRFPAELGSAVRNVMAGLDAIGLAAYRRLVTQMPILRSTLRLSPRMGLLNTLGVGAISGWSDLRTAPREFDVYHVVEQAPEPERRLTLGAACDRFGLPLPRVHFFVSERELASLERSEELVAARLAQAGLGRLRTARELAPNGDVASTLHPSVHHHLGTTRMHADARRGVVDADGRLHGLRNLFVTGGSLFPTSGYVNPTLTIVALAARLAAHLRGATP